MKWGLRLYAVILLAYTGWRTFDFISSTLPKNDMSFWLSIAFLFSSECGLLLWHELSLNHVTTDTQAQLANYMKWIDFVASTAAGVADMILRQTFYEGYVIPVALAQFLIYGLPAIMATNVGAFLVYESNDSETQLEREKQKVSFRIHKEALKDLKDSAESIAQDKKTLIYKHLRDQVTGKVDSVYMKALPKEPKVQAVPGPETPESHRMDAYRYSILNVDTDLPKEVHPNGKTPLSRNGAAHE